MVAISDVTGWCYTGAFDVLMTLTAQVNGLKHSKRFIFLRSQVRPKVHNITLKSGLSVKSGTD